MSSNARLGLSAPSARSAWPVGLLAVIATIGCGASTDEAISASSPTPGEEQPEQLGQQAAAGTADWCAVKRIMDKSCTACHDGEGTAGSPMGLTQADDFAKPSVFDPSKKVYEAVAARMRDKARPMPPRGLLPEADLQVIDQWVAAGAPTTGSCGEATDDAGEAWPPAECDEVYELRAHGTGGPGTPYVVPGNAEIHPQIRIDPPWGNEKVQALAFKPLTDNPKVIHHWILYNGMAFITGWAPGDDSTRTFPPDVGMDMPTGAGSLRLDMHYYNTGSAQAEEDRSGVAVCVVKGAKLRRHSAAVHMGFTSFGPVLAPANKRGHQATSTCRVTASQPVHLLTAGPHAHKYARHMKFTVRKANGQEIVMHDQPFAFGEQGTYPLDPPVVLETGDQVTTTCTFDNDTNRNITFGESTENEMCFNFATYYPKGALRCGGLGGLLGGR